MEYLQHIQRAVNYIETHLADELAVDAVARVAGLSRWHFQIIFHAMVGDTLAEYIRKRRLTAAAIALGATKSRVIEIALEAGFGSQESFTRAFKTMFGVPPGECRRCGLKAVMIRHKPKITRSYLNHLYQHITMKPVIKHIGKFKVIGLDARFISAVSPDADNFRIIPPLWEKFLKRLPEIKGLTARVQYGVVVCLDERAKKAHPDEMLYMACAPVKASTTAPRGMKSLIIPAGEYAVFTHKGPVANLGHTLNYIYASWLPKSGRTLRAAPHLEMLDARFKPDAKDSEMDVCVPVA
ncbi:MAG TPA: AraC family transcriptional regulator [Verrucomicrobiae bacterium]|nr:AraC family transcriptional regulator [Verrucomicrobiae bacterium]